MFRKRTQLVAEIPHLRRYARSLTRDAHAADDLVQTCLERALDRFHLWQPGRSLRPWLFTIMRNLFIDTQRRASNRELVLPFEELPTQPSQRANQENHMAARMVLQEIDRLPDEQREVLMLVGVNELSYAEAAQVLGIPQGTLMSRLHRGRAKLRERLDMSACGSIGRAGKIHRVK